MIYRLNKYKIVVLYDLKSLSLKVPLEVIDIYYKTRNERDIDAMHKYVPFRFSRFFF